MHACSNIIVGYFICTDFNSLKRYGASYGKLPSSFAQQKCSGRDQLCNEVSVVYCVQLMVIASLTC